MSGINCCCVREPGSTRDLRKLGSEVLRGTGDLVLKNGGRVRRLDQAKSAS